MAHAEDTSVFVYRIPTRHGICQLYGMSEAGMPARCDGAFKGARQGSVGTANVAFVLKVNVFLNKINK